MWEAFLNLLQPGLPWIIGLAFILLFAGGYAAGRVSGSRSKRSKTSNRRDDAFLKGFQYILSNDHDHAIEEFTKSVKVNSDTVETYIALGNLFRSKGEFDRAIRIRQSIILRSDIEEAIRLGAIFDLAVDYRKAGLINRALSVFLDVLNRAPGHVQALEEIEKIYEELKDWENAYKTRQRLAGIVRGEQKHILAHHLVEMGKGFLEKGDSHKAKGLFEKAVSTHKECVDAHLHLGDLFLQHGDLRKAVSSWRQVIRVSPDFAFLAYQRIEAAYDRIKEVFTVNDLLSESESLRSDSLVQMSLARLCLMEGDSSAAMEHVERVLTHNPSLRGARRLKGEILLSKGNLEEIAREYQEILRHLNFPDARFQCRQCGFEPKDLQWQCLQCKRWDTIRLVESQAINAALNRQRA